MSTTPQIIAVTGRYFFTLGELRQLLYGAYPAMSTVRWIDDALREMFDLAAPDPDPRHEGRRMITPAMWQEFSKMVARRIDQDIQIRLSG